MSTMIKVRGEKLSTLFINRVKKDFVKIRNQKYLLLLMIPALASLLLFSYAPMYGIIIAFKKFNPLVGIVESPWASPWYKYIEMLITDKTLLESVRNTLMYSTLNLLIAFPAPIVFALMLNELSNLRFKKIIQTISYLPYFLSWVVVSSIFIQMLSPSMGIYGLVCELFSIQKGLPMSNPFVFVNVVVGSGLWKGVGWGTVIYLATLSGIDLEQYEAAVCDGAGRLKQCMYITLPGLTPVIVIQLIFAMGGLFNSNFEQLFNLYNIQVRAVADVIDTYIYRMGVISGQYSFSTAMGLVKTILSLALVLITNRIAKRFSEFGIW